MGRVGFDCKMYVVQCKKYNEKLEAVIKYQLQTISCFSNNFKPSTLNIEFKVLNIEL